MSENAAYGARILTFDPSGRVVDATRGTFEPQTMRVETGQAASRPYAELADVPVSKVYLGVQPGATAEGASTALATTATDRSFIVIERENGYKQVIETDSAAAERAVAPESQVVPEPGVPAAGHDVAGGELAVPAGPAPSNETRGTPSGVAAETDLGAYLSPDAVAVELNAPAYADAAGHSNLTRYANELISNSQSLAPGVPDTGAGTQATEARGKTDGASLDAARSAPSADAWTSTLVRETAGAVGAADLERARVQVEARKAESGERSSSTTGRDSATQTSFDLGQGSGAGAPSQAAATQTPPARETGPQTETRGGSGAPVPPGEPATPERDPSREPKPELTPVERAQTASLPERGGRELVGERPAFERAADARLDTLQVKYHEYDVQETLASERTMASHQQSAQMAYVRDGEAATARAGYQQDGRIVAMTSESVTQDIGQGKVAVYSTRGLMESSNDPAGVQSALSRAAQQGSSVEINFSRSGGLAVADLSQSQGRNLGQGQDQDRGMGRSLF